MENITSELADRWYDIMVATLDSPDDYRRWSFVYAMLNAKITVYAIDSRLGPGAGFYPKNPPIVVCAKQEENSARIRMAQAANRALARHKIPRPRKRPAKVERQLQNA